MKSMKNSDVVFIGSTMLGNSMVFYFKEKTPKPTNETLCVPANTVAEAYQNLLMGEYYIKEGRVKP